MSTEQRFLNFVDAVAVALYGRVYDDCTRVQQLIVLGRVEEIHMTQVNERGIKRGQGSYR